MFFKTIIFTILAVGVFADEELVTEDKKAQLRAILRQQCKNNGAEDKVAEIENIGQNFLDCTRNLVNVTVLQKEIEAAKPNGALDEVFKTYCAKTPQLKTCIHTLLDGVSPCIDSVAREHITTAKNAADQLIDFVCYKDGDRIALFIAEGGPQCFQSKALDIKTCAENIKNSFSSIEQAKNLTVQQRCDKFKELQECVVQKLETCETPTPANMFESLARYIRNSTPCKKQDQ